MKEKLMPYLTVWTTRDIQLLRGTGGANMQMQSVNLEFIQIKIIAFRMYYAIFEHLWFKKQMMCKRWRNNKGKKWVFMWVLMPHISIVSYFYSKISQAKAVMFSFTTLKEHPVRSIKVEIHKKMKKCKQSQKFTPFYEPFASFD